MFKKIFIYFTVVMLACVMSLSIITYETVQDNYYFSVESSLEKSAKYVASKVVTREDLHNATIRDDIREYTQLTDSRFTIISDDGQVLFDTSTDFEKMENHISRPEMAEALSGNVGVSTRYSDTLDVDMMYVAVPVIVGEEIVGAVRSALPIDQLKAVTEIIIRQYLLTVCVVLGISILLFYFLVKGIVKPIGLASDFAKEIAHGNYQKRLSMIRNDEIGSLVDSLNHMAKQLESSFKQISQRNFQIESVISNVKNGIISVDENLRIVLINQSAKNMLGLNSEREIIGKGLLEIIRAYEFYSTIDNFKNNDETVSNFEFEHDNVLYSVYVKKVINQVKGKKQFIIVIEDITQIRKLENMRRDFVANVTHELKTPITSIKGFIETLLNGVEDEKSRYRFYSIVDKEVERLMRLVEDILALSSLENLGSLNKLDTEIIDIHPIMNDIYTMLEKSASAKNINFRVNIEENVGSIRFNPNYFKQMMINLIDNAIKYNREYGKVTVNIYTSDNKVIIEVKDDGIGIPEKDLSRIFERFYRVDKGRSRKAGGTGLGLAIVKHIAQIQNCEIDVKSKRGKGTVFTVSIPGV